MIGHYQWAIRSYGAKIVRAARMPGKTALNHAMVKRYVDSRIWMMRRMGA